MIRQILLVVVSALDHASQRLQWVADRAPGGPEELCGCEHPRSAHLAWWLACDDCRCTQFHTYRWW